MRLNLNPVIIGKPYPVMWGHGWRCFDGEKWHDCDGSGNIIKRGGD